MEFELLMKASKKLCYERSTLVTCKAAEKATSLHRR